jgi:NadR type nicotinamide-nucleotide adenylyltransferase
VSYARGVVIGKFLPPHRGHALLVETALARCARVDVIVCVRATDPIPGALRADWLRELHPSAQVQCIDDVYDPHDSELWARLTLRWLGARPDAVFSSEAYGEAWARAMGCACVAVDPARTRVPISGTAVRSDPYASWEFLSAPVRAWYAKRVVLVGAESTGKTTLAEALARALHTPWVPEYGRAFTLEKYARGEDSWNSEEFVQIAAEQQRQENATARDANRVLVCDTNAFATSLWHRRYLGSFDSDVDRIAARDRCDLYLLAGDEIPFVQDGIRDGEAIRHAMHGWFEDALRARPIPWVVMRGDPESRLRSALAAIGALFATSRWRPEELAPGPAHRGDA